MGDIVFTLDNYSIYQNNGYYICVSNRKVDNYQMFIGFSDKNLGLASNQVIVDEIRKISDLLFSHSIDPIYVIPVINPNELERVASVNDEKVYDSFLNHYIRPITMDVNNKFKTNNKHINDVIGIIKKNDVDKKIIDGIDMSITRELASRNIPLENIDYIREVDISILRKNNGIMDVEYIQTEDNVFLQKNPSVIEPINREHDNLVQNKENTLVRKLTKPTNGSHGFSSMSFIIMALSVAALLVGGIIYLLLK